MQMKKRQIALNIIFLGKEVFFLKDLLDIINVSGDAIAKASGCSTRKTKCSGDGCC